MIENRGNGGKAPTLFSPLIYVSNSAITIILYINLLSLVTHLVFCVIPGKVGAKSRGEVGRLGSGLV